MQARHAAYVLVAVHAALLGGAALQSPTAMEVGHFPAGLSHWYFHRFDLYRVNPPLVRLVATFPFATARPSINWDLYDARPGRRPQFAIGREFIEGNRAKGFLFFTIARWACIPFSIVGAAICYRWTLALYGRSSALVAITLWCFSPNIVAHASLITPDAAAGAMGLVATLFFWCWIHKRTWRSATIAGIALGMAELTKLTWVILYPLWLLLWIVVQCRTRCKFRAWRVGQFVFLILVSFYVLNLGYGFEESYRKLGDYVFISESLGGPKNQRSRMIDGGNRFRGTCLQSIPMTLPANYVYGIDRQKADFENKLWAYLRGQWQHGGWWYYYLYALAVKVPLGTWLLFFTAVLASLLLKGYSAPWRDELVLLAPAVVILVFVSSQTGINIGIRYILPMFPFLFIWISRLGRAFERDAQGCWLGGPHRAVRWLTAAGLTWMIASSLSVYPHSLSYFNELAGGPKNGHAHLLDSNIDWGQDLLYLKKWYDRHPQARPLGVAYSLAHTVDPSIAGIEYTPVPVGPASAGALSLAPERLGPQPGWYAVSVELLRSRTREYEYFLDFQPTAMAGYSIYIYHLTSKQASEARRRLGLPPLE